MDAPTIGPSLNSNTSYPLLLAIPPSAILLIIIGCYIVLISLIFLLRQICLSRGICKDLLCSCCGKEDDPRCCECCIALSDACSCRTPTVDQCLDSCCPKRSLDCVGFFLCQCCGSTQNNQVEPCCSCGDMNFNCACVQPDFNQVNCLCCQIGNSNYPRHDLD